MNLSDSNIATGQCFIYIPIGLRRNMYETLYFYKQEVNYVSFYEKK